MLLVPNLSKMIIVLGTKLAFGRLGLATSFQDVGAILDSQSSAEI